MELGHGCTSVAVVEVGADMMRRSSNLQVSGPLVPFSRLRFIWVGNKLKVLVRSKVEGLSGVVAL